MNFDSKKFLSGTFFLLVGLFLALGVALFLFFSQIKNYYRSGFLRMSQSPGELFRRKRFVSPIAPSVENVTSWMTFHYLEKAFRLPVDYFQDKLKINDPNYPRVTLEQYAFKNHLNKQDLIAQVKKAIMDYNSTSPSSL